MKLKQLFYALPFALTLCTTFPNFADTYEIDTAHSNVSFKVSHLGISKVNGNFSNVSGIVEYEDFFTNPSKASEASTSVTIEISSINTGIEKRDAHLKGKDFFNIEEYPQMTFTSSRVEVSDENTFYLVGDLTLHGVTKPVILEAVYNGSAISPFDGTKKIAFSATTTINRKDYGLSWNKQLETGGLLVGEEIDISINIEADKK